MITNGFHANSEWLTEAHKMDKALACFGRDPSRLALIAAFAVSTLGTAAAQNQPAAGAAASSAAVPMEEIVVTGSRIARPELTQPNPVAQINSEQIQISGLQSTVDILTQTPQTANNSDSQNNNRYVNGAGLQQINLRGLGTYRTLTLVDGRRHVGSLSGVNNSGGTGSVDVATIPPLLIDHIDVVTGGSSAIYGADAVAGVVNFVMKKNYEGAEMQFYSGGAEAGGKATNTLDGIIGTNFADDRGNVTVAFDISNQTAVEATQRDYATRTVQLGINPATGNFTDYNDVRSSRYTASGAPTIATVLPGHPAWTLALKDDGSGLTPFNRGSLVPGNTAFALAGTNNGFNVDTPRTLETPNTRNVVDTTAHYKLFENVGPFESINFFTDLKYADSRGDYYQGANFSNGTIGATQRNALLVPITNPYIPADLSALLTANPGSLQHTALGQPAVALTRQEADWANRRFNYEYQYFRAVAGLNGKFENGWNYEIYYNYGRNRTLFANTDRITANLNNALDSVVDPATGKIVCRSAATNTTCAPINPFKVGKLPSNAYNYIYTQIHENDLLTEDDAAANVSGDLFSFATPFSGTVAPVGVAFGVEWRREATDTHPDPLALQQTGTIFGNQSGTGPTIGAYQSREFYAETTVPVLRDLPFAKAVDLDGAIRYQNYSTTGADYTWNGRGTWAVTDDIKFRAGWAKSVRAPNGDELFSTGGQSFIQIADPCSIQRINANPARLVNCRAAGVPVGFDQTTAATPSSFITGNPGLNSEIGRSFTAGAVFTPTFVPHLELTADYFQVRVKGAVIVTDATSTANSCYDAGSLCNFVTRNADGSLNSVLTPYINSGFETVRGMDFTGRYQIDLDQLGLHNGALLNLNFAVSWVPQHTLVPDRTNAAADQHLAGTVGFPNVKGTFHVTYEQDNFSVTFTTRYIGGTQLYKSSPGSIYEQNDVPDLWYEDIYVRYDWNNYGVFFGINNLSDKAPPYLSTTYNGGNFPDGLGTLVNQFQANPGFDTTGRFFYGGVSVKF